MNEMNGPQSTGILSFDQALATVLEHAANLPSAEAETVLIRNAAGRVLAQPIIADRDQPPFDRSTRDGFAVHAAEWSSGTALRVIAQLRAGEAWQLGELPSGAAVEIMTGAPVPPGADAVAMVEHATLQQQRTADEPRTANISDGVPPRQLPLAPMGVAAGLSLRKSNGTDQSGFSRGYFGSEVRAAEGRHVSPGENIVPRGTEARAGAVVVPTGSIITAAEIAEAASCGISGLQVYQRPQVAIIATGDELVGLKEQPAAHQIRNSNSFALAALVQAAGGEPHRLPIARDTRKALRSRIAASTILGSDLILFSGGVSAGKYDLVEEVLAEHKAEFLFTGVRMQPGKPAVFGRMPAASPRDPTLRFRYFFGLPGNPVSTEVTFHCFVAPMIRALSGGGVSAPRFVQATLDEDVTAKSGLTRVLPAHLTPDLLRPAVRLVAWHGSGDLAANARANCYAVLPDGRDLHSGDVITVLLR
jgi:molybdopterin molybdotransferase